ncbi:hypothetical protein [Dyella sp. GSA-30]|uniref:hypothetical protein n=1 Tax=Dyella sp. GSA-30 TaxID=2994496 RepID=UPI00248FAE62|nr:hypothetical protein [Dyella sp. GSA-30]
MKTRSPLLALVGIAICYSPLQAATNQDCARLLRSGRTWDQPSRLYLDSTVWRAAGLVVDASAMPIQGFSYAEHKYWVSTFYSDYSPVGLAPLSKNGIRLSNVRFLKAVPAMGKDEPAVKMVMYSDARVSYAIRCKNSNKDRLVVDVYVKIDHRDALAESIALDAKAK